MIESLDTGLTNTVSFLGRLNGLPGYALVFLLCIGMGFLLKTITCFPNSGIPLAVVFMGAIGNSFIADPRADDLPLRLWLGKNLVFGALVGLLAWAVHYNRRRIPLVKKFFRDEDQTKFMVKPVLVTTNKVKMKVKG